MPDIPFIRELCHSLDLHDRADAEHRFASYINLVVGITERLDRQSKCITALDISKKSSHESSL